MDHENPNSNNQPVQDHQPISAPERSQLPSLLKQSDSLARVIEKGSAWVLITSAILFALIAILAVWGAFGDNSSAAWKSIASLGIIALAALVINVSARIFEGKH
jgi:hypothetical protein